jgi:hypothetical protein
VWPNAVAEVRVLQSTVAIDSIPVRSVQSAGVALVIKSVTACLPSGSTIVTPATAGTSISARCWMLATPTPTRGVRFVQKRVHPFVPLLLLSVVCIPRLLLPVHASVRMLFPPAVPVHLLPKSAMDGRSVSPLSAKRCTADIGLT